MSTTHEEHQSGWLDRVKAEYTGLLLRITKLENLIGDEERFDAEVPDGQHQGLLIAQLAAMRHYASVLRYRIRLEEEEAILD